MITSQIETITPTKAAEYLSHNTKNRTLNRNLIKFLSNEINEGKWKINGETIIFSEDGRLQDGQHRLYAVIDSGIPIQMLVVRGVSNDVFDTIDQGKARTAGDVLTAAGINQGLAIAAVLRKYWTLHCGKKALDISTGNTSKKTVSISSGGVLALYEGYQNETIWAQSIANYTRKKLPLLTGAETGGIAMFLIVDKNWPKPIVEKFFMMLMVQDLCENPSVAKLRSILVKDRISIRHMSGATKLAIVTKAFNSYVTGRPLKCLKWSKGEISPEFKNFKEND